MKKISDEDLSSVHQRPSKESGYTGLVTLHRLSKLYGFNVQKDTVFDVMHNIPLKVTSTLLKELIPCGKLDPKISEDSVQMFPWTAGTASVNLINLL